MVGNAGEEADDVLVGCGQSLWKVVFEHVLEPLEGVMDVGFWVVVWKACSKEITDGCSNSVQHGSDSAVAEGYNGTCRGELFLLFGEDVGFGEPALHVEQPGMLWQGALDQAGDVVKCGAGCDWYGLENVDVVETFGSEGDV